MLALHELIRISLQTAPFSNALSLSLNSLKPCNLEGSRFELEVRSWEPKDLICKHSTLMEMIFRWKRFAK